MARFLPKSLALFFVCALCTVILAPKLASALGKEGGGGTNAGSEFSAAMAENIAGYQRFPEFRKRFPELTLEMLQSTLSARVVPKKKVFIDVVGDNGQSRKVEVVASNYREQNLIEVSEELWPEVKLDGCRRQRIVLHEQLGLLGLEKNSYEISSRVCELPGSTHVQLPDTPENKVTPGMNPEARTSMDRNFVRIELHLSKRQYTRTQARRRYSGLEGGSFVSLFVETDSHYILINVFKRNDGGGEEHSEKP